MEARVGGLFFTSKFDSGNLAKVERVSRDEDEDAVLSHIVGELRPDYEYNIWTSPDCADTEFENGNRSWFHFGVRGGCPGKLIKFNIMNMNRQGKLYSQGHCPLTKTVPGRPKWERIRDKPTFETNDGQFVLSFTHRFLEFKAAMVYFSFSYPWSYTESQEQLADLDAKYQHCRKLNPLSSPDCVYYHRELLCHSLDKLRIDLITISSCHGLKSQKEPRFDRKLFPDKQTPRCKKFKNKKVFVLTSRVHPGESPASSVFNGFLEFILREDDLRAVQLRRQYVFKLIPMLNPDGVMRGHYRTDSRGVNLNRMYLDPDFSLYPSVYAAKSVIVYHHIHNRTFKVGDSKDVEIDFPGERVASPDIHNISSKSKSVFYQNAANEPNVLERNQSSNNSFLRRSDAFSEYSQEPSENGQHVPVNIEPLNLTELDKPDTPDDFRRVRDSNVTDSIVASSNDSSIISVLKLTHDPGLRVDSELKLRLSALTMSDDYKDSCYRADTLDSDADDFGDTERLGNEGSDEEGGDIILSDLDSRVYAPHLFDPKLKEISPEESGIAFYVDLHGHASKRGCFMYGNYFEAEETQLEGMLFCKLISMNSAHFDFTACNFTERNMYTKDKRDGSSKEGSGRVSIYKALGITHSYTLECNYNTGRMVNAIAPAYGDDGRASPVPLAGFPPKYTQAHYEEVGRALAIAALDFTESNPWSRIVMSELVSVHGVRDSVRRHLRGQRGGPKFTRTTARIMTRNNSIAPPPSNLNNNRISNPALQSVTRSKTMVNQASTRNGNAVFQNLNKTLNNAPIRNTNRSSNTATEQMTNGKNNGTTQNNSKSNNAASQNNSRSNNSTNQNNSRSNNSVSQNNYRNHTSANQNNPRSNNSANQSNPKSNNSANQNNNKTGNANSSKSSLTSNKDEEFQAGMSRLGSSQSDTSASASRERQASQLAFKHDLAPVKEGQVAGRALKNTRRRMTLPACNTSSSPTKRAASSGPIKTPVSAPVPLTMTTVVLDTPINALHLSDAATHKEEEDKVEQLKSLGPLVGRQRTPSRIPIPAGRQFIRLTAPTPSELSAPRPPSSDLPKTLPRPLVNVLPPHLIDEIMQTTKKTHPTENIELENKIPLSDVPEAVRISGARKRRRFFNKRSTLTNSPKQGVPSKPQQGKLFSGTDSDVEKKHTRRRRRGQRKRTKSSGSPSSDDNVTKAVDKILHEDSVEGAAMTLSPRIVSLAMTQHQQNPSVNLPFL